MSKSAVCLDRALSSWLGRKKVQQCKSGSPTLFPDKILARAEHDSLIQRPHLFSWTCLMTKSGYGQGKTWWECFLNIMQDGLWTELQVCSAPLVPVHVCLSSASGVSLSCVQWCSMISTLALLTLTVKISIFKKISLLDSCSSGAFVIDLVKQRRSKKSERTSSCSIFKTP